MLVVRANAFDKDDQRHTPPVDAAPLDIVKMASFNNVWTKNTDATSQKKWSTADKVKLSNKTAAFKAAKDTRNARKSNGKSGSNAKGKTKKGGGGNGVRWGRPGDEMDYKTVLDKNDPNYDSQDDDDTAFFVGSGDTGTHGYGR